MIADAEWDKQMPDGQKSSLKWIKDKVSQLQKQMILQNADLQDGGFDEEVPHYLESLWSCWIIRCVEPEVKILYICVCVIWCVSWNFLRIHKDSYFMNDID